jgi:glutamate dehydrogenase/leucine dehydrogenase
VVAVSDANGGIYNPKGLSTWAVLAHTQENGTVTGYAEADEITNAELLSLECDVLVPAALENQIHEENAAQVRAKVIAEGANGPTTPEVSRFPTLSGCRDWSGTFGPRLRSTNASSGSWSAPSTTSNRLLRGKM